VIEKYKNKYRIASTRAAWWNYSWAGAYFIIICTQNRFHYFGNIENQKMELSQIGVLADVFWHEIPKHTTNVELGSFVIMPNHIHGILIFQPPQSTNITAETRHALSQNVNDHVNQNVIDNEYDNVNKNVNGNQNGNNKNEYDNVNKNVNGNQNGNNKNEYDNVNKNVNGNPNSNNKNEYDNVNKNENSGKLETRHALSLRRENDPNFGTNRFQNQGKNTVSSIVGSYKSAVTRHCNRLGYEFGWQTRFHDHIIRNDNEYQRINDYIENNPIKWELDKFFVVKK
jgi:putative transposase